MLSLRLTGFDPERPFGATNGSVSITMSFRDVACVAIRLKACFASLLIGFDGEFYG